MNEAVWRWLRRVTAALAQALLLAPSLFPQTRLSGCLKISEIRDPSPVAVASQLRLMYRLAAIRYDELSKSKLGVTIHA